MTPTYVQDFHKTKSVRGCAQGEFGCWILHAFNIVWIFGVTDVVNGMSYSTEIDFIT